MSTVRTILRPESITQTPIRPTDADVCKLPGVLGSNPEAVGKKQLFIQKELAVDFKYGGRLPELTFDQE